jgi:DNA-binding MarR family transcriptional regulator
LSKRDTTRTLCDDIWEQLFDSINGATCLKRREKAVLSYLWNHCKIRSISSEPYPGHEEAGATLGISPLAVHAALVSLERKGLIKMIEAAGRRRKISYRLNAFLLECAYDKVRLKKTS